MAAVADPDYRLEIKHLFQTEMKKTSWRKEVEEERSRE